MFLKNKLSIAVSLVVAVASNSSYAAPKVTVLDKTLKPSANFLAYTEFELSGEPLAESLGLDLDILDPSQANMPTAFDFSAGIESYEYSEEAMYALNYQSSMGPHLANGPLNTLRGGKLENLGARFVEMAKSVGFSSSEIPLNMYPISLPYYSGVPELAQQADITSINGEELEVVTAKGNEATVKTIIPAYYRDYKSLSWDTSRFEKVINPASLGGIFLKEVMWSQDFLGGMHVTETNEEVEASSSTMDQDGIHSLGVSAADGFNGMVLTELSVDKLLVLQNQLGFDGSKLGVSFDPSYDAAKKPVWFAHKVAVQQGAKNALNSIEGLSVLDGSSQLEDIWLTLWPVSEFFAFTDQRVANTAQNPAFLSVFDGAPFAASPLQNTDKNVNNDILGNDAFSLANNISNLLFSNMSTLHFNQKAGTLVTEYVDGKQGQQVNTFDAAYSLVALSIFQRAQDALPVGYASADGGDVDLKTSKGKVALMMIKAQADFILQNLIAKNGLVYEGLILEAGVAKQVNTTTSLDAQFSSIRGLVAAFLATDDVRYKQAARSIYMSVDKHMFDSSINTWAEQPGIATEHTPYTAAAISGGLREAMLHLKNEEGETVEALELQSLVNRYVSWFKGVINGGMQLSEWLGDSGENLLKDSNSVDSDEDGVRQLTAAGGKFGTAMVMANKVSVE